VIEAESRFSESAHRAGSRQAGTGGRLTDRLFGIGSVGSGASALGAPGRIAVGLASVLLLALAIFAAPARAATNHVAGPTFESSPPSSFSSPINVAVDETDGSVYVLHNRGELKKFTAAGAPSDFSAVGGNSLVADCENSCMQVTVDNTGGPNQGVIYVSSSESVPPEGGCCGDGGIEVYLPSGTFVRKIKTLSQFVWGVRACGVGVTESGDLVISHGEGQTDFAYSDLVDVPGSWESNPTQKTTLSGTIGSDFAFPCKTAVSSTGRIYVMSGSEWYATGQLRYWGIDDFGEPDPVGDRVPASLMRTSTVVDTGPAGGFALDGDDNVYVTRNSGTRRIRKIDPDGSLIETFAIDELEEPSGVAVNESTGVLYAADRSESTTEDVHIFNPVTVPDSLTGSFDATGQTTGDLLGEVDPAGAGNITGCEFQYTTLQKFTEKEFEETSSAPCDPPAPLASADEVEASISGLTMETAYRFRLVTTNANGTSNGTVRKFTPHAVVGLTTEDASDVAPRSATLNASFEGNGESTTYKFQYGTTIGYGSETTPEPAGEPVGPETVSTPVDELELETLYHYRVVATNETGTSVAEDGTFTTPPAVAGVNTSAASDIGQEGLTLNGEFVGDGSDVSYWYEYGPTKAYGLESDVTQLTAPDGTTPAPTVIDRFQGYTTYHYRLVTENSLGKTYGPDMTVTTLAAPLPLIAGTSSSAVTPTTATLSGEVNPNRWATTYLFEWGPTTEYGSATSQSDVLGSLDDEFHPVSTQVSGLEPGTLYHYRIVAINLTGVTNGPDMTFVTPNAPTIESATVSAVTQTSAHLSSLVTANGSPTTVRFEYGTNGAYGSATGPVPIGSDLIGHQVSADISGLQPGTTYQVRAVAGNGIGTTTGSGVVFTTQGAPVKSGPRKPPLRCKKGFKKVKVKGKAKCKKVKKKKKKHKKRKRKAKGNRNG